MAIDALPVGRLDGRWVAGGSVELSVSVSRTWIHISRLLLHTSKIQLQTPLPVSLTLNLLSMASKISKLKLLDYAHSASRVITFDIPGTRCSVGSACESFGIQVFRYSGPYTYGRGTYQIASSRFHVLLRYASTKY